ncbi:MAG: Crp/Fnr family transcriptional regulator [Gemmatimonadaceae bacterium]|nr:Crp/Fnr family transcriptional regulator [Gemmatimonadaceae bacterium]
MTPHDAEAFFARFPAFAAIDGAERRTLVERTALKQVPAGTTFLREGDACGTIALVLEGTVRVSKSAASGRAITLYQIVAGETCVLTASCLLATARYPADAVVVDDATVALVPGDLFTHLFHVAPSVQRFVLEHFTERLAATMALVEDVAFRRVDQRVARWLVEAARTTPVIATSHEQLAAELGTARVVISRILADFQQRGWVTQARRRLEVRDPAALEAFGNESD